jgi:hypothetical protein
VAECVRKLRGALLRLYVASFVGPWQQMTSRVTVMQSRLVPSVPPPSSVASDRSSGQQCVCAGSVSGES